MSGETPTLITRWRHKDSVQKAKVPLGLTQMMILVYRVHYTESLIYIRDIISAGAVKFVQLQPRKT